MSDSQYYCEFIIFHCIQIFMEFVDCIKTIFFFFFLLQFKIFIENYTFVREKKPISTSVLASLILVACYISYSHFSTIQLRLINEYATDFESYFYY